MAGGGRHKRKYPQIQPDKISGQYIGKLGGVVQREQGEAEAILEKERGEKMCCTKRPI